MCLFSPSHGTQWPVVSTSSTERPINAPHFYFIGPSATSSTGVFYYWSTSFTGRSVLYFVYIFYFRWPINPLPLQLVFSPRHPPQLVHQCPPPPPSPPSVWSRYYTEMPSWIGSRSPLLCLVGTVNSLLKCSLNALCDLNYDALKRYLPFNRSTEFTLQCVHNIFIYIMFSCGHGSWERRFLQLKKYVNVLITLSLLLLSILSFYFFISLFFLHFFSVTINTTSLYHCFHFLNF